MKPSRVMAFAGACSALLFAGCAARQGSLVGSAPSVAVGRVNPLASDPEARLAGARLYASACAGCHGEKREGSGRAPVLATPRIYDAPPGALFWVVRSGSVFSGMPSFADIPAPQRWQIVAFLTQDRSGSASASRNH
jgi:mono/diheme cytochrome c family protein